MRLRANFEDEARVFAAKVVEAGNVEQFSRMIILAPDMYRILVEIGDKSGFSGGRVVLKRAAKEILETINA